MIGNPRPRCVVMSQDTEAAPIGQLLADHFGSGFRLQAQRMAAKVPKLATRGVMRMVKLLRETGERIGRVQGRSLGAMTRLYGQEGACMMVPHTLHVRCCRLE